MPSATPRRQSSHRRRRSTNTTHQPATHQPRPPRAQAQRRGQAGYPQRPGKNGNGAPQAPAKASGKATPNKTAPLPPLELERATGTAAATPPPHPAIDAPPATPQVAHPLAGGPAAIPTLPPAPATQSDGVLIPPRPTVSPLPRATLPPPITQPAPPAPIQPQDTPHNAQQQRHPSALRRRRRPPNVRAALAYAIPFAPALWLLAYERRARFVRMHAAQSLAFFGLLALGQAVLYIALVILGQTVTAPTGAFALGILFLLLFGVLGLGGFVLWLLLLANAMTGTLHIYPGLSRLATLVERTATRLQLRFERDGGFHSRATRKE